DVLVALALTIGGGIEYIDALWRPLALALPVHGTLVVLSVLLVTSAIALPLSIWRTFVIEARFGFNRTTPALFVADLLKSMVLSALLGAPLIFVVLLLMQRAGAWWWLYAWFVWVGFTLLI